MRLELRDLELMVSLSRHKNFSLAASDCNISQPAFSTRIRKFEERLKLPLVRRGNSFGGFTPEGEGALSLRNVLSMDSPGTYGWILYQTRKNNQAIGRIPSYDELFAKNALGDISAIAAQ